MELKNSIFVYMEQEKDALTKLSVQVLGKAREMADSCPHKVVALLIGKGVKTLAPKAIGYGADAVIVVDQDELDTFDSQVYAKIAAEAIKQYEPSVFLLGATNDSRDIGGRLSASLQLGLVADCIDATFEGADDTVMWIRPAYTGKLFVKIMTKTRPQLATASEDIFLHTIFDDKRRGDVIELTVDVGDIAKTQKVLSFEEVAAEKMTYSLEDAEIIVGAGRGVGDIDGMNAVQDFAASIGAGFGVTKPLVDAGWIDHEAQIGITGKKVAPKIYIALGISGALQHKLGIKDAEIIIAVNKDPDAPIFKFAHYGIVGDLFEAMPELAAKIAQLKA